MADNSYIYKGIYLEVGKGWLKLIDPLIDYVLEHDIDGFQMKEKFGMLSVWYSTPDNLFYKMVREAENLSQVTCEFCGAPGKLRQGTWLKTRCDKCQHKWEQENGNRYQTLRAKRLSNDNF